MCSRPYPSRTEQTQILELKRAKAEAEAQEAVVLRRRDALEAQVEAVESELVHLTGEAAAADAQCQAQVEALASLNAQISEVRDAHKKLSEAAQREYGGAAGRGGAADVFSDSPCYLSFAVEQKVETFPPVII